MQTKDIPLPIQFQHKEAEKSRSTIGFYKVLLTIIIINIIIFSISDDSSILTFDVYVTDPFFSGLFH